MNRSFDEVWEDIIKVLSKCRAVRTLVRKIRNNIICIEHDHIKVVSDKTGKIRKIPRSQFEQVWNALTTKGLYISKEHKPYIHSQIICAILSKLNYVEVKYNPLTIYLKE